MGVSSDKIVRFSVRISAIFPRKELKIDHFFFENRKLHRFISYFPASSVDISFSFRQNVGKNNDGAPEIYSQNSKIFWVTIVIANKKINNVGYDCRSDNVCLWLVNSSVLFKISSMHYKKKKKSPEPECAASGVFENILTPNRLWKP